MRRPGYPYVICKQHDLQQGFAVCRCVARGLEPVAMVEKPTRRSLGFIGCDYHLVHAEETTTDELFLMCVACAREQGIQKVGGRMKEPYK